MHQAGREEPTQTRSRLFFSPTFRFLLVSAAVFASLFAFSALKTPVPGSDEPHYLTKGRHYWQPEWCSRDLFLQSADAHLVFYQTIGSLTQFLTFEQATWTGRVLAFLVVAVGWTAMASRLLPGLHGDPGGEGASHAATWPALWALWVYLLLSTLGSFSREWIIEGVEAKVFAYGLVFLGLSFAFDRRWLWSAAALGAATSFHPIVGGWSVVCAAFAALVVGRTANSEASSNHSALRIPHSALLTLAAATVSLLCALPGLVPAVRILTTSVSAETAFQADYLQVFERLSHHLNPERFETKSYVMYGALIVFWLVGRRRAALGRSECFFAWFVAGSILVAGVGLLVGWNAQPPADLAAGEQMLYALRMKFLKFYPFRLFDAVMPIAAAVVIVGWATKWTGRRQEAAGRVQEAGVRVFPSSLLPFLSSSLLWLFFGAAFVASMLIPSIHRNPSGLSPRQLADFQNACRWIQAETDPDALVLTPLGKAPFKWYAERAEWVSPKDCPQDSEHLVEWKRRLVYLRGWMRTHRGGVVSRETVKQLQKDTGVDYILTSYLRPFEIEPAYQNATYRVYRLSDEQLTTDH